VLSVLLLVPWRPVFIRSALLDDSWKLALNELAARGAHHGTDVVFTYGPLGFVLVDAYHPATFPSMLFLRVAVATAFAAGSWSLARSASWPVLVSVPWVCLLLGTAGGNAEPLAFSVPLLWVLLHVVTGGRVNGVTGLVAGAAATVSLTKLSVLPPSLSAAVLVAADEIVRLKRVPRTPLLFAAVWLGLWLGADQPLANIPAFMRGTFEIAGGYSATMSMIEVDPGIPFSYLAIVGGAWWAALRATRRRLGGHGALLVAQVPLAFFVAFKAGIVRFGSYPSTLALLVAIVMLLPFFWTGCRGWHRWAVCLVLPTAAAVLSSIMLARNGTTLPREVSRAYARIPERARAALALTRGHDLFFAEYEQARQRIRDESPLPLVTGTVDIYSHAIAAVLARDMDYRPRPVIQSYSAYTPWLASLNARRLRSPQAPDSILFHPSTIDLRYWSLDDGLSWPDLLTRYAVRGFRNDYLLLGRIDDAREYVLEPMLETRIRVGETLRLPRSREPIWARLSIRPTALGHLRAAVFRAPEVVLKVRSRRRADPQEWRLVLGTASEGFLLSPIVQSGLDFAVLASTPPGQRWLLDSVRELSVEVRSDRPSVWVQTDLDLSLHALRFPRQDLASTPDLADLPQYLEMTAEQPVKDSLRVTSWPQGRAVLLAHPPSELPLRVPRSARRITVGYGILPQAWDKTTGVEFLVWGQTRAQLPRHLLWSHVLRPKYNPQDRGLFEKTIDVGPGPMERLVFETRGVEGLGWAWAVWGTLRWHHEVGSAGR
jgi:hypothetical protein